MACLQKVKVGTGYLKNDKNDNHEKLAMIYFFLD